MTTQLGEHSIMVGTTRHWRRLRVSLDGNVAVMSLPRAGKTGWLARAILHAPATGGGQR